MDFSVKNSLMLFISAFLICFISGIQGKYGGYAKIDQKHDRLVGTNNYQTSGGSAIVNEGLL